VSFNRTLRVVRHSLFIIIVGFEWRLTDFHFFFTIMYFERMGY
jgi:hypothetical protein